MRLSRLYRVWDTAEEGGAGRGGAGRGQATLPLKVKVQQRLYLPTSQL